VESAAYAIVAQAARAAAGALAVRGERTNGVLRIEVDTPDRIADLAGLEDRIGALDGRLAVDRTPEGRVRICAEMPCES
jgi:hypothetical protein